MMVVLVFYATVLWVLYTVYVAIITPVSLYMRIHNINFRSCLKYSNIHLRQDLWCTTFQIKFFFPKLIQYVYYVCAMRVLYFRARRSIVAATLIVKYVYYSMYFEYGYYSMSMYKLLLLLLVLHVLQIFCARTPAIVEFFCLYFFCITIF